MSSFLFQGEEKFNASRQSLWQLLTDLRNVPRCVPNFQNPKFPAPNTLTGTLMSPFTFFRGSMDLTIELKELNAPQSGRMTITARGMGSRAVVEGSMRLLEEAGQTVLQWQATATLEGLVSAVSKGLVEGAAKKTIAEMFDVVRKELAAQQPSAKPA